MKRALLAAGLALWAGASAAIPLNPGGVIFPTGVTQTDPIHGGPQTVINDNLINFSLDPSPLSPLTNVSGDLQNRVTEVLNTGSNLRFAPRIRNTMNLDGGIFAIVAMRLTGFGDFDLDVDNRTDGLGDTGFTSVSRSVSGDILTFRFDDQDPVIVGSLFGQPQEESLFTSIVTDAEHFALTGTATIFGFLIDEDSFNGGRIVQDGDFISVTIDGLAVPVAAPIPLPASAWIFASGLAGFGLMRRRRS